MATGEVNVSLVHMLLDVLSVFKICSLDLNRLIQGRNLFEVFDGAKG